MISGEVRANHLSAVGNPNRIGEEVASCGEAVVGSHNQKRATGEAGSIPRQAPSKRIGTDLCFQLLPRRAGEDIKSGTKTRHFRR